MNRAVLLGLAGIIGLASGGYSADLKIVTENDVVYTKVGEKELKLDMARPAEGDGPFPGVLVIHGGAWRAGDKNSNRSLLQEFAKRGYVAISPQYRFCPTDKFPAQVYDVKASVRWLRSKSKELKLDSDHIGATGFSAGGHLALMLGVTGPKDELEGDVPADAPSSKVQAVVNYFGPTDMNAEDIPEVSKPLVRDFLGTLPKENPKLASQASPITYVTSDDPPTLTFQGTKDPLVPHTQAFRLTDAQTAAGVPGRVELIVGGGHGNWGGVEIKRTMDSAMNFFDDHLKPKKK